MDILAAMEAANGEADDLLEAEDEDEDEDEEPADAPLEEL